MTNEEAIQSIEAIRQKFLRQYGEETMVAVLIDGDDVRAFDAAISALKERPKGEWLIIDDCENFTAKCSICGRIEDSRMVNKYPFCHCGADMRKPTKKHECDRCSKTFGTLECCDMVNNKWIYSCEADDRKGEPWETN